MQANNLAGPYVEDSRRSMDMGRVDIMGTRRKERLANDLLKMHGDNSIDVINSGLQKIDHNQLIGLSE